MLRLRPYNTDDADTILSWTKDEKAFYKWTAGVLGNYPLSAEQFNDVGNRMAFTAIDDNDIVGFFTMRQPSESFDELRFGFVVVDSSRRGRGIGKQMLKLGLKFAKEIYGAKKVSLGVFKNNESAYYCYKSAGFTDVTTDEIEIYQVLGEEWECLEMEMNLE
ncbi:MAG: GNAT family N-acetyltransferase [Clostridia bacterium]|nr:GNAT family N-acetyltransferase [Clostridia bacterium]